MSAARTVLTQDEDRGIARPDVLRRSLRFPLRRSTRSPSEGRRRFGWSAVFTRRYISSRGASGVRAGPVEERRYA